MVEELLITDTQLYIALAIALILAPFALRKLLNAPISSQEDADGVLNKSEGYYTEEDLNPEYGAYIWFAGKRFN